MSAGYVWVFDLGGLKDDLMTGEKLKSLSEFEWASVAQYMVYISITAGLKEVDSSRVISFPMARLGTVAVLKRKKGTLLLLNENRKRIERFADEYKDQLSANEMSVLRSLYLQYKKGAEMVQGHIDIAESWIEELDGHRVQLDWEGEDDLLF